MLLNEDVADREAVNIAAPIEDDRLVLELHEVVRILAQVVKHFRVQGKVTKQSLVMVTPTVVPVGLTNQVSKNFLVIREDSTHSKGQT